MNVVTVLCPFDANVHVLSGSQQNASVLPMLSGQVVEIDLDRVNLIAI